MLTLFTNFLSFVLLDQVLLLFLFLLDASITAHKESKNGKERKVLVYHDLEKKRI